MNTLAHRWYSQMTQNLQGPSTTTYEPNSERVSRVVTGSLVTGVSAETSYVTYAYNGAVSQDLRRTAYGPGMASRQLKVIVNSYDAERRLTSSYFLLDSTPHPRLPYVAYSRMERYRYDPLGRRVWREMIRDTLNLICTAQDKPSGCRNEVTRTVWDGDQVLYDVRATADTIGDSSEGYPSNTLFTGRVGYTHAGGIDTPLEIIKGSEVVLPIADWRGQYATGTCPGTKCDPNDYYFPGAQGSTFEEPVPLPNGPPRWIGELVTGMADGSGYQYKRNRYYSPSSGRFTQEDPIGVEGGLGLYGFGGGDPLNFSDPFGLRDAVSRTRGDEPPAADSSRRDPCSVYGSSPTIEFICRMTTGPQADSANKCTADCLSKQWAEAEARIARPLNKGEKFDYIFKDHPTCYNACGYRPMQFVLDFTRPKSGPAQYVCAKVGTNCTSP